MMSASPMVCYFWLWFLSAVWCVPLGAGLPRASTPAAISVVKRKVNLLPLNLSATTATPMLTCNYPVCPSQALVPHSKCFEIGKGPACLCEKGFHTVTPSQVKSRPYDCEPCPAGRHGRNCTSSCSCVNSWNDGTCDPVDGQCNCTDGYKGIRCDEVCQCNVGPNVDPIDRCRRFCTRICSESTCSAGCAKGCSVTSFPPQHGSRQFTSHTTTPTASSVLTTQPATNTTSAKQQSPSPGTVKDTNDTAVPIILAISLTIGSVALLLISIVVVRNHIHKRKSTTSHTSDHQWPLNNASAKWTSRCNTAHQAAMLGTPRVPNGSSQPFIHFKQDMTAPALMCHGKVCRSTAVEYAVSDIMKQDFGNEQTKSRVYHELEQSTVSEDTPKATAQSQSTEASTDSHYGTLDTVHRY